MKSQHSKQKVTVLHHLGTPLLYTIILLALLAMSSFLVSALAQ